MDITCYKHESSNPKWDAQANLRDRTHYVSDDTLRYHKSRILQTRIAFGGLIFGLVESVAKNMSGSARGFRYAIIDIFGTVIHRPNLADTYKSSAKAAKAMDEIIDGLAVEELTLAAIDNYERQHARTVQALRATVQKYLSELDTHHSYTCTVIGNIIAKYAYTPPITDTKPEE